MTPLTFQTEMDRLSDTFGAYKRERMQLIWIEVKDGPDDWFREFVNELIGTERQAPLLDKFREGISKYRERSWKREKQIHQEHVHGSMMSNDDIQTVCQGILRRIERGMDNKGWDSFIHTLKSSASDSMIDGCNYCDATGRIWQKEGGYEFLFRCSCRYGDKHRNLKTIKL